MQLKWLLLVLLLGWQVWGNTFTSAQIDFVESLNQGNLPLIQKIQKQAIIDYSFSLVPDNLWHQYPELDIKFTLKFRQFVRIDMGLHALAGRGDGYLVPKLYIDGKENNKFRAHSGHHWFHNIFTTTEVFLEPGQHRVWVEYRHGYGWRTMQKDWDWMNNYLTVTYHCLAPS